MSKWYINLVWHRHSYNNDKFIIKSYMHENIKPERTAQRKKQDRKKVCVLIHTPKVLGHLNSLPYLF